MVVVGFNMDQESQWITASEMSLPLTAMDGTGIYEPVPRNLLVGREIAED